MSTSTRGVLGAASLVAVVVVATSPGNVLKMSGYGANGVNVLVPGGLHVYASLTASSRTAASPLACDGSPENMLNVTSCGAALDE